MKNLDGQIIKLNRNTTIIMEVKSVRKHKGVPQGMIYEKGCPARLVLYVNSNVPWKSSYWVPVVPVETVEL